MSHSHVGAHCALPERPRRTPSMTTPQEDPLLLYTRGAASGAGLLLTTVFVVLECARGSLRQFARRLVVCLVAANMQFALGTLWEIVFYPRLQCAVLGFHRTFVSLLALGYSLSITTNVYAVIHSGKDLRARERMLHISVWALSLSLASLPLVGGNYGPAGFLCWIQGETAWGNSLRYITFYGPLWIVIAYVLVAFSLTMRTAYSVQSQVLQSRRPGAMDASKSAPGSSSRLPRAFLADAALRACRPPHAEDSALVFVVKRLAFFPAIFLLVWAFPTFHRTYLCVARGARSYPPLSPTNHPVSLVHPSSPLWMPAVHGVVTQMQGEAGWRWGRSERNPRPRPCAARARLLLTRRYHRHPQCVVVLPSIHHHTVAALQDIRSVWRARSRGGSKERRRGGGGGRRVLRPRVYCLSVVTSRAIA